MDRRIQIVMSIAIIAALIAVYAYSAGWFAKTSSADITFSITHHEGNEAVWYSVQEGFSFWEIISDVSGEVSPGETEEITVTHEWRGTDPSSTFVGISLSYTYSGEIKRYIDGADFKVIPGGDYRMECHIFINEFQTDPGFYIEDVYVVYPSSGEPFAPYYSGTLNLNLRNEDSEDWNKFFVVVDGVAKTGGVLGPQSSQNVTISVNWDRSYDPNVHYASLEVYSGNPTCFDYAELIPMENGTIVSVVVAI